MNSIICEILGLMITSYDNSYTDPQIEQAVYNSIHILYNILATKTNILIGLDALLDAKKQILVERFSK